MLRRRVLARGDLFAWSPRTRGSRSYHRACSHRALLLLAPLIKPQTQEKGACLQGRAEGLPEGLFTGK